MAQDEQEARHRSRKRTRQRYAVRDGISVTVVVEAEVHDELADMAAAAGVSVSRIYRQELEAARALRHGSPGGRP